jgi:hypothetical protein
VSRQRPGCAASAPRSPRARPPTPRWPAGHDARRLALYWVAQRCSPPLSLPKGAGAGSAKRPSAVLARQVAVPAAAVAARQQRPPPPPPSRARCRRSGARASPFTRCRRGATPGRP